MNKKWLWISFIILCKFVFSAPVERISFEVTMREDSPVSTLFPVGLYWVPKASMAEVRQAGFNYVIPIPDEIAPISAGEDQFASRALAYLDAARDNGLKCGFFLDKRDLELFQQGRLSWEEISEALRLLAAHPALLFYYFRDEPENEEDSSVSDPLFLEDFAARIKELDPLHPTFLVNFATRVYYKYAAIPDIYSIDLYPVPNLPLVSISSALDEAFKATGWQSPVWFTVQAFGNTSGIARAPSPRELRCMTYLSLVQGVSGIQFFRYCGERWRSLQPPALWQEMVKVTRELNLLSPVLTRGTRVDASQVGRSAALDLGILVYENSSYLIAVNRENRRVEGKIELPVAPGGVEVLFEERFLEVTTAGFKDTFGPYATHVYKLDRYFWLHTGLRGSKVEVGRSLNLLVLHNLAATGDFSFQVDTLPGVPVAGSQEGEYFSWTPLDWGEYRLQVSAESGKDKATTSLALQAEYAGAPDVWHSYAVRIDEVFSRGQVTDGNGKAMDVAFYIAPADNVREGIPFSDYTGGSHPLVWNRVDSFWSLGGDKLYPYVGKKSKPRFINFGNTHLDLPVKVRDLAIHPPCGSRVTVAALTIPESGFYTVLDLAIRKDAVCGDPLVLKFYDSSPVAIETLLSSDQKWVTAKEGIVLGELEAGEKLYFSLGSLGDCSCDFAELRWTLQRTGAKP